LTDRAQIQAVAQLRLGSHSLAECGVWTF
jgi:hypothetical protein